MSSWKTLADIRREYGTLSLNEDNVAECPLTQFKLWFAEVVQTEKFDPTAMVLSTVDERGYPDSRVVLLKGLEEGNFQFYTNYQSIKAEQLKHCPHVALNFYWPEMARQVRIRGRVKRLKKEDSDAYFYSRPITSQLSALASPQSRKIAGRAILEANLAKLVEEQQHSALKRPSYWGGYCVIPEEIEFWQGRDNRLHDRIFYYKEKGQWQHCRLAP